MQADSGRTTRRVSSNGGVELAVRESGDPDGPTIVFIHGYPDTKEMWDPVASRLAERFHVVAFRRLWTSWIPAKGIQTVNLNFRVRGQVHRAAPISSRSNRYPEAR